jgi:hypothetical protein
MGIREKIDANKLAEKGHVLLISPSTFNYHRSISSTLNKLGYEVTWWDERAYNNFLYKLALRVFPNTTKKYFDKPYMDKLSELNFHSITHVLIIKGEGISRRAALKFRQKLTNASFGLYLWDSLDNVKGVTNILDIFDSISTFDPYDSKVFNWVYRPLFSRNSQIVKKEKTIPKKYDWCFIGSAHSDRHRVIHRLRKSSDRDKLSFVFCYFQSSLVLLFRKIIDWTLWFAPAGSLSIQSMPSLDVQHYMNLSAAVLDVEHPKQRGLTMRTIETLISEKKLITTNKNIISSNLYDKSRVYIINRRDPQLSNHFIDCPFLPIPDPLKYYYSCEGWVSELLKLQDLNKKLMKFNA